MKIVWVTNSTAAPTGFGTQAKLIIRELQKQGHECHVICRPTTLTSNLCKEHQVQNYNWEGIDAKICEIQPDAVICFEGHRLLLDLMQMRVTPANCPVYFWWPFEGSSVPKDINLRTGFARESIVHLSQFAKDLWKNSDKVIPHAYDPTFRKLPQSKAELRRKWILKHKLPLLETGLVAVNVNRNFFHKGWDDLFYALSITQRDDIQLVCKTSAKFPEEKGGLDLKNVARMHGVEDKVLFVEKPLSTEELNELYNLADLQIDLSHGEGYGLTVLECGMAGTPQIVNSHTTMPEIKWLTGNITLIEPASYSYRMGTTWAQPNALEVAEELELWDSQSTRFSGYEPDREETAPKTIAGKWEDILRKKPENWNRYRYGYTAGNGVHTARQSAAKLCQMMGWSALEVGSYDAAFGHWASIFDVTHKCLEIQDHVAEKPKDQISLVDSYLEDWPEYDCLVITNSLDQILGPLNQTECLEILSRIQGYDHVLLLAEPCYKWRSKRFSDDQLRASMHAVGLKRFPTFEERFRRKAPHFVHEVWSTGLSLPKELHDDPQN